ncbi:hypothetical protein LIER_35503 [Lithospermum erythrorhizon]|uniref:RNase H type-1 domain-containing protein n=1 Tax=Lithospermum erythrorhizon TaxID=34254 RepID=A0AAV3NRS4_LITER
MDQINGECGVKNEILMKYHEKTVTMVKGFDQTIFQHVPRALNEEADRLSQLATTIYDELPKDVYIKLQDHPSYEERILASVLEEPEDWKTPIASGLKKNMLQTKANKGAGTEELPPVMWSLLTTPSHVTGKTPFAIVYGTETVLQVEVGLPSYRQRELSHLNGKLINDTWHVTKLRKYYV